MKHHHLQLTLFMVYLAISTLIMVKQGIGITPDRYIVVLFVGAAFIHRGKQFLHDFLPFLLLLLSYEFLRGFADDLNHRIHYFEPIRATQWLFNNHIPTVELQHRFFSLGMFHWYDYLATVLYLLHFAVPFGFAFVLWLYNRKYFVEFMVSLAILSYAGFISYLLFPIAPPWLAAKMGYIPPVVKIFNLVLATMPETLRLPTLYRLIGTNLVAALPSMHAAYSTLVALFCFKFFGKSGLLLTIYAVAMWLAIVYLGEHYVIDIVVELFMPWCHLRWLT